MKLKLTLLVFKEGERQGEIDVIAEYPDAVAALNAVAQLGAASSTQAQHLDVQALLRSLSPKSLARFHEQLGEGVVVLVRSVAEHRDVMPEELRSHPHAFHLIASRPKRDIPPEGIIKPVHEGQVH